MSNIDQAHSDAAQQPIEADTLAAKALAFDPDRYRHHVEHLNMSAEAQAELLVVVWRMMQSFVDIAFGDDPAQLARIAGDSRAATGESSVASTLRSTAIAEIEFDKSLTEVFRRSGQGD